MRVAVVVALALAAPQAEGGAWPRGEGRGFVSVGHVASTDRAVLAGGALGPDAAGIDGYSTVFAEYGITDRLTFGLDFGIDNDRDGWTALLFVRRSFPGDGPNVWAVELAAGPRGLTGDARETVVRPSLQWGRGTDWGWMSVESYAELRTKSEGTAMKLDATLGWRQTEAVSWILQVQSAAYPGADPTVRLAPSYVRRMGERLRLELGLVTDVAGREDVGLKLGTWLEF